MEDEKWMRLVEGIITFNQRIDILEAKFNFLYSTLVEKKIIVEPEKQET